MWHVVHDGSVYDAVAHAHVVNFGNSQSIWKFPLLSSTPQLPSKTPQIPFDRDHKALNRCTLGGCRYLQVLRKIKFPNCYPQDALGKLAARYESNVLPHSQDLNPEGPDTSIFLL